MVADNDHGRGTQEAEVGREDSRVTSVLERLSQLESRVGTQLEHLVELQQQQVAFICLSVCLSVCLAGWLYSSVCLSMCVHVHLYGWLAVYPAIGGNLCLYACLSGQLAVCICLLSIVCLSVHPR